MGSEKNLGILFAVKFSISAKLPTEEYVLPYFNVLSISINFRNDVTFIETIISPLKTLHPWQKWDVLCATQKI